MFDFPSYAKIRDAGKLGIQMGGKTQHGFKYWMTGRHLHLKLSRGEFCLP
jgi:hypothetical protein